MQTGKTIKRLFVLLTYVALTLFTCHATAEPLRKVIIGHEQPVALASMFNSRGFDILEGSVTDSELAIIVSSQEYDIVMREHQRSDWKIISVERGQPLRNLVGFNTASRAIPNGYFDLDEINQRLVDVATSFPDITRLVNLTQTYNAPQTFEGRDLFALKISDNPELDEDEPSLLIVSTHHAREIITPVIALDAITRLTTGYANDPAIASAVDNSTIWIAPMWNPDGYNEVVNGDNFWRKNRRVLPGGIGVDQNRNYPTGWSSTCGGSTFVPSQTYRGTGPASEPETQLMMTWSEDQRFTRVVDYHSFGSEVLYGYSCSSHPFSNYFFGEAVDLSIASGYAGSNRPAGAEGEHYQWQLARYGAWSHLVETATEFQPSFAVAQTESDRVWPGILHALNRPVPLTGLVTDSVTGAAISAQIIFQGIVFNLNEQFSSNPRFGRYYLFAPDDTYTLEFSAEGYASQTFVVDFSVTNTLDVQLIPDVIDADGDGIGDSEDNCVLVANAAQIDADNDGYGNVCDADVNNDCTINFIDVSMVSEGFLSDDPVLDLNSDGVVNFVDFSLLPDSFLQPPGPSGVTSFCL